MEEIIRNGAVFGGLLAVPLLSWRSRWRHHTVLVALVLGLALAFASLFSPVILIVAAIAALASANPELGK